MAYSFQIFTFQQILEAAQCNQIEVNIRDHVHGTAGVAVVPITGGGSGQITAQLAINALTNVSAATNEYVLLKDTATGNAIFDVVVIAGGGTGQVTAQLAINALTQVSAATTAHVLTKSSGGDAAWQAATGSGFKGTTASTSSSTALNTTPTELITLAITGGIAAGDIILFTLNVKYTKDGTAGTCTATVAKNTGTGAMNTTGTEVYKHYATANELFYDSYDIVFTVATPGTFTFGVTLDVSAGAATGTVYGAYTKFAA